MTYLLCLFCCSVAVNLDGRETTETERIFLLKWKEMRKARHKQGKKPYPLMSDTTIEGSSHAAYPHRNTRKSMFVHPLTMPALPARQLPRKRKNRPPPNQGVPCGTLALTDTWTTGAGDIGSDGVADVLSRHKSDYDATDNLRTAEGEQVKQNTTDVCGRVKTSEDLKLPAIIPHHSLIAQSGNLLSSDHLQRKLWQASQKIPGKVFE